MSFGNGNREPDHRSVSAPADVASAWAEAQGQNRPVLLRVNRNGQSRFVAVEG